MYTLGVESAIVRIWADYVRRGERAIEDVPEAFDMRESVKKLLSIEAKEVTK